MENFNEFINYIARTNLFNFVIFLSIIIFLVRKINVSGKLEDAKNGIAQNIENSKNAKFESESLLSEVEKSVENLEEEIDSIIKKSEANARLVGDKILADAQNAVLGVKENSVKSAEARAGHLKNDILKRAMKASVEVAKDHILSELGRNPDLHNKLIDESINALDGVVL